MPNYKLIYFPGRGLTECSRLSFHYAGQKFEDVRLTQEEFEKQKHSFPNGQVPVLEVDGRKISQSTAILRFIANRFGLSGKDEFETAKLDETLAFFYDEIRAQIPYTLLLLGKSTGDKEKLHNEVFLPVANRSLDYYSNLLKGSKSGFVLDSGVSAADFVVVEHLTTIFGIDASLASKHPDLVKYKEKVHALPQIADYVKSRPQTIV